MKYLIPALFLIVTLSGCRSMQSADMYGSENFYGEPLMADMAMEDGAAAPQTDLMLIWTGSMTIEVLSISNAVEQVSIKVKEAGGYIDASNQREYGNRPTTTLSLRIPSDQLELMLGSLDGIGEISEKRLASEDVTERYIDMQARLETKKKLRDRLQNLLDRADEVKDVLAIEKELTRLQADIDSMTARLKAMKGKVDFATLTITLNAKEHEKVLGPLGYVWEGAGWCVKKLFVWKDASYEQQ
jgi:hypothetical protein